MAASAAHVDEALFDGAVLHRAPQQARSRDKVARALAAAEQLASRGGPGALSLTAVAREAGVSVGALHQYLPDREAIVRALVTRYHSRFEALMSELVAGPAVASDDPVELVVDAFADVYRRSAGLRALGAEAGGRDEAAFAHKARMAALLAELLRARGLRHAPVVARTAFVTADALLHEAFRDDRRGDDAVIEQLKVLLRGYLG